VAHYRVYCLDGANKVVSAEWIEAADDAAAIALVREQFGGKKCEVWDRRRLVGTVDLREQGGRP
jgi:hypothetical protein